MKSTQIKTEAEAKAEWDCPLARIKSSSSGKCEGSPCPAWRWMPVMMKKEHAEAIQLCIKERDMKHADAAAYVADQPGEFGLPTGPFEGFCGIGGEVLA